MTMVRWLGHADATSLARGIIAKAAADGGAPVTVGVAGGDGVLLVLERMDGAPALGVNIIAAKLYTAVVGLKDTIERHGKGVNPADYADPRITTFGGVGLDILARSNVQGTYGTNQPHDHSASFITGVVYDMGQLKWTMTATYATTALITSHSENFYYLQPGVLWYVPSKYTFHSRTQWIVGFGVRTTWGPDGFDFGTSSRLRAEITFRQVMDTIRKKTSRSP